ncbi:MAG: molybdopterin-dependent oxidoreductase [Azospirillaceae bacterium]|nr:molybdopterin-dependent oxidoreductase [Azospirillaceae bacterium]
MSPGALRTTCPYCGVGCGLEVDRDGQLRGDQDHPANAGRLCSKGAALASTLGPADRLRAPTSGGAAVSWDQALDHVAAQFAGAIAAHGPDSVAFYVSGQFLTEDYYVANKLMKGFIGSGNIDTNSRLCMASSVAGHVRAFGEDVVPGCYEDLDQADLAILVGSNTAWCHPVLYQRLIAAREARGTRLVVIDPRLTATGDTADLHLPVRAGTDVMLFAGLLAFLAQTGALDSAWIRDHVAGFDEACAAARACAGSLEVVATATGVAAADLRRFYQDFADTERVVTLYSQGVNQSESGTDKVNAIINCHLATGRIGRPGMGPFSLTGQPNAMGGREVGGLANQLAAHMGFEDRADIDRVRRFWDAPTLATRPGLKAVELFDAVADGRIKAIWIAATNPVASMPRADHVRAALAGCPFVVVSDCWPTDTTALADVVLPAAAWAEKDGTVTNSERRISRQRAFRKPPGEARADWWMFAAVARRLGWGEAFAFANPASVFREHAALSAFENDGRRCFDLGGLAGLDDAAYDALAPVAWPVRTANTGSGRGAGQSRLFAMGRFPTPDGRARMVATRPPVIVPNDRDHPLRLNTGRLRDQWHTMTRTGRVASLMTHAPEPLLDVHPYDAAPRGLEDGGLVRIESPDAVSVLRVRITPRQRPGEVFAAMHWTAQFAASGAIDRLVSATTDPLSGQPDLKGTRVRISALSTLWRGILIRSGALAGMLPPPLGEGVVWSMVPLTRGVAFHLAGWHPLRDVITTEGRLRALLHLPEDAELVTYSDPKRSVFRYAGLRQGRLEACLFLAMTAEDLPGVDAAAARLGEDLAASQRSAILAGGGGVAGALSERSVCTCFGVGVATIETAIRAHAITNVAAIGQLLRAGTNCGSCIPELKTILQATIQDVETIVN